MEKKPDLNSGLLNNKTDLITLNIVQELKRELKATADIYFCV